MKVPVAPTTEPSQVPAQSLEPQPENIPSVAPMDNTNSQDMPFGKEKFDAGIDVDENADPKKYIEKLTGKLAQKLRDFNGTESDTDLNKFVINSLIPAAIPQMDDADTQDVIKKINDNNGGNEQSDDNSEFDQQSDDNLGNNSPGNIQQESKDSEIEDLISEILGTKKNKPKNGRKNPFKGPEFK